MACWRHCLGVMNTAVRNAKYNKTQLNTNNDRYRLVARAATKVHNEALCGATIIPLPNLFPMKRRVISTQFSIYMLCDGLVFLLRFKQYMESFTEKAAIASAPRNGTWTIDDRPSPPLHQ